MSRSLKKKLFLSLAVGAILFALLITRPWYTPTVVNFTQVPVGATITVHLEDSWGREVRKTHDPSKQGVRIEYSSARVAGFESNSSDSIGVSLQWYKTVIPYTFVGKIRIDDPQPQRRWTLVTAAALIIFCGFCVILTFLLLHEWEFIRTWQRKSKIGFLVVVCSLVTMGMLVNPGFFGWDIVGNFVSATRFENSSFTGRFYSYLFIAGYQLLPVMWLVTASNVFVTLICLYHIFTFAQRRGLQKYFYGALALFIFYPANFYMTYYPGRDLAALWCFVMTLFKLFEIWLDREEHWLPHAWLTFFATCAVLLRQEALLPIGALLLYENFRHKKNRQRFHWLVLMIPLMSWVTFTFIRRDQTLEDDFYESTLLVNPLSSILSTKYATQLPPEVNEKLGPFFKNDYLLKYHNPFDIDPFHSGGLNRNEATHTDYLRFRSAAIDIIRENPSLFVENRWALNQTMLGLNFKRYMFTEDSYFIRRTPDIGQMFETLPIQDYQRWPWVEVCLRWWRQEMHSRQEIYFQSYLIPLLLWLVWFFISRSRSFVILSVVLLTRTLIVALTAPAAYYKYQLTLWMFVPFVLVYLLAEKHQTSSLGDPSHIA